MTRSGLAEQLAKRGKTSASQADLVVETIFDCMKSALKRGERVEVRGLGTFKVRSYKGYQGRNPKTGEALVVRPKRLPVFKVGREMVERVAKRPTSGSERTLASNTTVTGGSEREPEPLRSGLADRMG